MHFRFSPGAEGPLGQTDNDSDVNDELYIPAQITSEHRENEPINYKSRIPNSIKDLVDMYRIRWQHTQHMGLADRYNLRRELEKDEATKVHAISPHRLGCDKSWKGYPGTQCESFRT